MRVLGVRLAFALLFGATALAGCQRAPAPASDGPAAAALASFEDLHAQAAARVDQGDWPGAQLALEEALRRRPGDVHTRYLHALVLSRLDLRDHAAEGFRWVVDNGAPGSEDVEQARNWLIRAGVLRAPEPAASPEPERDEPTGRLRGRTRWELADNEQVTADLILEGTGTATAGRTYACKVMLNDAYEFPSLVPGEYRLRALRNGVQLWETPVVVGENEPTVVDLGTPAPAGRPGGG